MAGGGSGGDKTEKATPKRREEARKKGQVAKSPDLNGAVVLLASLFALSIWGPHIWQEMGTSMRSTLALISNPQARPAPASAGCSWRTGAPRCWPWRPSRSSASCSACCRTSAR
jgi:FlhB HrpN YscU SpaS Family